MPPITCRRAHSVRAEIAKAKSAGQRSGGASRDEIQTNATSAAKSEISTIADAGSHPAAPEATNAEQAAVAVNQGFERLEVRRHAHTASARTTEATTTAVVGKVSTGRHTQQMASARSTECATMSREIAGSAATSSADRAVGDSAPIALNANGPVPQGMMAWSPDNLTAQKIGGTEVPPAELERRIKISRSGYLPDMT